MTADLSDLVVEILHNRGDDNNPDWSVGSGFFVGTRLVLTAWHNVDGPGELLVRVHGKEEHPAIVSLQGDKDLDLAVLEVPDAEVDVPALRYGEVVRRVAQLVERCWAVGYPQFKILEHERGKPNPPPASAHVNGEIPTGDYLGQQLLTLQVGKSPRSQPQESEWAGMSGAVVFSGDYIVVGVIIVHHLPEGESALTVVPITALDLLPEAEVRKWWKLLGVDRQAFVHLPGDAYIDHPTTYLPFPRNTLFQPRPDEFERLENLLLQPDKARQLVRIGLTGMGGIGKTQLAVEFAYRYQDRFPGGIFWLPATGHTHFDWQRHFADLASKANYLPADDDRSNPENEARRARHFCRYLAEQPGVLLILDNVEDPNLVLSVLPNLAGKEPVCAILYTSRNTLPLPGISLHSVELLSEGTALRLLLESTRPKLFAAVIADHRDEEVDAARFICQKIGYLPLALMHLQRQLARDPRMTLVRLAEVLKQRGAFDLAKIQQGDATPLFATFRLSWERIEQESTQRLFKLVCYFPEAAPIPLWLLGLAAGLGESGDAFEPLGEALLQLQDWSLLEGLSEEQVNLHPLVREFGQRLSTEAGDKGKALVEEAAKRLVSKCTSLNWLEQRARRDGYYECLEQVRDMHAYTCSLEAASQAEQVERIERWLDRESYLLGDGRLWPLMIPGLFYQQLYNRSIQEGYPLTAEEVPARWLRQEGRVSAEDRSLLRMFAGHAGHVSSVAFSPDGTKILTGSWDQTVRLWETARGTLITKLQGLPPKVSSVAFSPDGTKILTHSDDGPAQLWEVVSGKELALPGHTGILSSAAFSPDGTKIFIRSKGGKARLCEWPSGTLITMLHGHAGRVFSAVFSRDGTKLLTRSKDAYTRLWETASGTLITTLPGSSLRVAFSPDGTKILTGEFDNTAQLWETTSGRQLTTLRGHTETVLSVAFSPDGTEILTGSLDNTVRLWEAISGKELALLQHRDVVWSVAFSPDGTKILAGSDDGTVWLWETASAKLLPKLQIGRDIDVVFSGRMFPDDSKMPTDSEDETVISRGSVMQMKFSPNGKHIVTISEGGYTRLWETASGTLITTLQGFAWHRENMTFSLDSSLLLKTSDDGKVRLWETASGKQLATLKDFKDGAVSGAFSPDGTKIFLSDMYGRAHLWETASGRQLATLKDFKRDVMTGAFSPDGTKILTGSGDRTARLWETVSGTLIATLPGSGLFVSFSPDGTKILTISAETAQLWETASQTLLATITMPDEAPVWNVAFSPNGEQLLMSSTYGRTVWLWETASGTMLAKLATAEGVDKNWVPQGAVEFSPDSRFLITCDTRGQVLLWGVGELDRGHLLGVYSASYGILAIHWQDTTHVILAGARRVYSQPHFYHLKLEGTW